MVNPKEGGLCLGYINFSLTGWFIGKIGWRTTAEKFTLQQMVFLSIVFSG